MIKIKQDYMYKKIAGQDIIIPVGQTGMNTNSMMTLKGSGAFVYEMFYKGATVDEVVKELTETYDIDEVTARRDTENFVEKLKELNMLDE